MSKNKNQLEAIPCDGCGDIAIFVVDLDWSEIDYDADGGLEENIIHGRKEYALCRRCANQSGSDGHAASFIDR